MKIETEGTFGTEKWMKEIPNPWDFLWARQNLKGKSL